MYLSGQHSASRTVDGMPTDEVRPRAESVTSAGRSRPRQERLGVDSGWE